MCLYVNVSLCRCARLHVSVHVYLCACMKGGLIILGTCTFKLMSPCSAPVAHPGPFSCQPKYLFLLTLVLRALPGLLVI